MVGPVAGSQGRTQRFEPGSSRKRATLIRTEIIQERKSCRIRDLRTGLIIGVVDHYLHRDLQVPHLSLHGFRNPKTDIVYGADFVLLASTLLKCPVEEVRPYTKRNRGASVNALQAVEDLFDLCRIGHLDQKGRAQLPGPRKLFVIASQLFADALRGEDPLSPDHLLDLEQDGIPVLEYEGGPITDRDSAPLLQVDDALAKGISLAFVFLERQHVFQCQRLHKPYACLMTSIGCRVGFPPPACVSWTPTEDNLTRPNPLERPPPPGPLLPRSSSTDRRTRP